MTDLRVADFDYDLPPERIAQEPPAERGASRMLVLDRQTGEHYDNLFVNFAAHLHPGDLLVLNDSRVIPARLFARRTLVREREKPSGRIEVMLLEPVPDPTGANQWRALVRPGRKVAIGERLVFPAPKSPAQTAALKGHGFSRAVKASTIRPALAAEGAFLLDAGSDPRLTGEILLEAEVLERGQFGERLLEFAPVDDSIAGDFFAVLDRIGHTPLPPYIHRDDSGADRKRYQTVFARERGSVAAPTAGLHFTPSMLAALRDRGVEIAHITLHVGLGTFAPLRVDRVADVRLHRERYSISAEAADAVNRAIAERRRIVAVGTTVVRTLEFAALAARDAPIQPHFGSTELFISPGFEFRLVSALLTNFHLPQSSLIMLVSAFAGRERVLAAYRHAVEQKYRFFSYGDCMFIG